MTYKATLPPIDSNLTLSFKTKQKENELKEVDYAYYDLVNNDNQVNNNMSVILRFLPFVAPFCLDEKNKNKHVRIIIHVNLILVKMKKIN
ncbi:MAG: hypothetical protein QS2022_8380 [Candidatus Phytoplasma asteris]|uniref:Uncharacterized protein n=1 Tax='Chrysanthemum coronarium' phytoplasma TaxID=1520703 RepID=A0ABQ0J485_9MOLU|nr:hypothetical protein ['Chrysanthemum coronarium' phytoplasma]TKA87683.1 MAG: hypothetical protein PLY_8330 [Periwinkle leaf yellowing phytoplasma]WEX20046.1 MAG: hypothetical protein QS2022_8380 [Candidatus Phytoplasma asteris]GAK74389.1 uncharacterized protein OYV_08970 ['Chrysanthemum coronarium' phytoplasma]